MKQPILLLASIATMLSASAEFKTGLSYDDVLLVPDYFPGTTRSDISTRTRLSRNLTINMPIISANMDTVTESEMAIAMANLGGIGIIHRFNTIDQQVAEVKRVKRFRSTVIKNPITIHFNATIKEARELMKMHGITSLLVVEESGKLVGILTSRDRRFNPDDSTRVAQIMTPRNLLIVARANITIDEAKKLMIQYKIEKLPIINDDGSIAGLITGKDIHKKMTAPHAAVDTHNRLLVGAAIGVKADALERAQALVDAEVDVLVIDIAHGDSALAVEIVKTVKEAFPTIDVIAGNVATAEGTRRLIEAGADAIKVGVGPGSICTTRIVTGAGYPQLSAIMECAKVAQEYTVPVIADGGIKCSGDITKAISAGASTVMLGSMLAGTEESPGKAFVKNGKYKVIRGMASFGANLGRKSTGDAGKQDAEFVPEGVEATISYKGHLREVMHHYLGGLKSGLSYCGATSIEQACGKCNFIRLTSAGMRESHSHDVNEAVR